MENIDSHIVIELPTMSTADKFEVKKSSFIWKVDKFSQLCEKPGDSHQSRTFELGDLNNELKAKWQLNLYPFGRNEECEEKYVCVGFKFIPGGDIKSTNSEYFLEISILDDTANNATIDKGRVNLGKFDFLKYYYGWPKIILRSDLFRKKSTLLKDDTLVISFSMEKKCDRTKEDDISATMVKEYESLYLSQEFSDVTIVIKDKEIKAHKCILSSRCKVFSAMLKHDMEERNTSIIRIDDVDYDVMKDFLQFVYCGKVSNIKKSARSLLAVCDKYDMMELKKICEKSLWDNVTVETACEILLLADLHNCKALKSNIINYIVTNIKEVFLTTSFDDLLNSHPILLKEALGELMNQRIID